MAERNIIQRIAKLLELSKSPEPHEAASALAKAQSLLAEHNLSTDHLLAANIVGKIIHTRNQKKNNWEISLIACLNRALGIQNIFYSGTKDMVIFGAENRVELYEHLFIFLDRSIWQARREYVNGLHGNMLRTTKVRRADIFCAAWVAEVSSKVITFALSEADTQAMEAYRKLTFGVLTTAETRNRLEKAKDRDWSAHSDGQIAGRNVRIDRPIKGSERSKQGLLHCEK